MFHTLFEYKDQNIPNNNQLPKNGSIEYNKKSKYNNYDNYYIKGNQSYNLNNSNDFNHHKTKTNINDSQQFENTRNKIKVVVYKNGFILNDGPFRHKSIPENAKFLEQVERGVIPHEIMVKGISDLGILLINRKTEKYHSHNLNSNILNASYNNIGQLKYPNYANFPYSYHNQNNININTNELNTDRINYNNNNTIYLGMPRINSSSNIKFPQNLEKIYTNRHHRRHYHHQDEQTERQNYTEPNEEDNKKGFKAFSGTGKIIKNINMNGLYVNKNAKNNVDINLPICTLIIRLFNGDVVKCHFNYYHTLREVYFHVRNISGSSNFHLLDGFPPRPLRDYDKTLYELGLNNSMLTQRIN